MKHQPKKVRHSSPRPIRGRDRREAKRADREALTYILHPALFEKQERLPGGAA